MARYKIKVYYYRTHVHTYVNHVACMDFCNLIGLYKWSIHFIETYSYNSQGDLQAPTYIYNLKHKNDWYSCSWSYKADH